MCRLLGYIGAPISLENLLYQPSHSLIVQSYQPREMENALLNADGFGVGWYRTVPSIESFIYKNTVPIWNDSNLVQLSRYAESSCILGYVRSATSGQEISMSNCQPFVKDEVLLAHNGLIEDFRATLYRPIRELLSDELYQWVQGSTDSEHIGALILNQREKQPDLPWDEALMQALVQITILASIKKARCAANMMISTGKELIASRYATRGNIPSLYWIRDAPSFPNSVIVASEPLFEGDWKSCPEHSILSVGEDLNVNISKCRFAQFA
ncbi:MAG: ergothioneine biosynthesis protein EgtC [Jaaginema sp. PMC 1079.18]|nr:ergothioneine biosynthesis protein EgtC [Jaaginema sp. PMC 1080.18]MEC4851407.1 ergothioneine biosynthesis protein EgtC [Jaaginema sp. PMC 1079.18]MEC4868222.1 ergothioneine biosynthesis protein EgtC [Jaaginema sp. PMC 1078.18]